MFKLFLKCSDRSLAFIGAFIILSGVLLIFLPIVLYGIHEVITQGEIRYTQMEVLGANKFLQYEVEQLDQTLLDWSSWDDTYAFAMDGSQEYIDKNLNNSTLENIDVDVFLTLNAERQIVHVQYRSQALKLGVPFDITAFLETYPALLDFPDGADGSRGLAILSDMPVLAAARPILNSQGSGPAQGTLVFLRILDEQKLQYYSYLTQRNFRILSTTQKQALPVDFPSPEAFTKPVLVRTRDAQVVQGYQYLSDLNGDLRLVLRTETPRDLYGQGQITSLVFSGAMISLGLILFGLAFYFARILLRSRRLGNQYLKRFQAIIEQSREAILLVSEDFRVLEVNKASVHLLGWERSLTRPNNLKQLIRFTPDLKAAAVRESCQSGKISEYHCTRRDGLTFDVELSASLIQDDNRIAYSLILRDITARKQMEARLRYDALHDSLTGLGNRMLLLEYLHHVNEWKKRHPDLLYGLLFIDFDGFKQVNDTLGHWAGDLLLVEAARRLEASVRPTDIISRMSGGETLARIAGDEFVVLLEDVRSVDDILLVAESITNRLSQPYQIHGKQVRLSISVGLVIPEKVCANVEDIIRDADIAMYRAKQQGGGQVVRFNPEMYHDALDRMQLEHDLRRAIENHELLVYYQPIYALNGGRITGFEALVRWKHPTRGLLSPAVFIDIAEQTGLIAPIGNFVMEEACRTIQSWKQETWHAADLVVSVNLAARQIHNGQLVETVRSTLARTHFNPASLWLEVTENTLVNSSELVLSQLNALRAMGVHIEIDDFGMGYSSLSYLQNLPLDGFKLDRSFIRDIQGRGQQVIKALVDLGHSLMLSVVAEGVETEEQRDFLKSVGCDYSQGYLMSRPVSASEARKMIAPVRAPNASSTRGSDQRSPGGQFALGKDLS